MLLPVMTRGVHGPGCYKTQHGWICDERCNVEDMRSLNSQVITVDDLLGVEENIERIWRRLPLIKLAVPTFSFSYYATRVSVRRKFKNGRSRADDEVVSYETWVRGKARGRWRAEKHLEAGKDQPPETLLR